MCIHPLIPSIFKRHRHTRLTTTLRGQPSADWILIKCTPASCVTSVHIHSCVGSVITPRIVLIHTELIFLTPSHHIECTLVDGSHHVECTVLMVRYQINVTHATFHRTTRHTAGLPGLRTATSSIDRSNRRTTQGSTDTL